MDSRPILSIEVSITQWYNFGPSFGDRLNFATSEQTVTITLNFVGNYYGLRGQHEKAVLYFQRALKLNPNYLSAWTLMGHEYVEIKNTSAAIQAYRQAIGMSNYKPTSQYASDQIHHRIKTNVNVQLELK